jgi:hypothetical protein
MEGKTFQHDVKENTFPNMMLRDRESLGEVYF